MSIADAIRARMAELGLSRRDLIPIIGSKSRVADIVNGRRAPTVRQIRALHQYLGISLETLLGLPPSSTPDLSNCSAAVLDVIRAQASMPPRDEDYPKFELARAAAAYVMAAGYSDHARSYGKLRNEYAGTRYSDLRAMWPWDWSEFKPRDRRSDLLQGIVLAIAEIERLDQINAQVAP